MSTRLATASPGFDWEEGGLVADEAVLETATQAVMSADGHSGTCPACGAGYNPKDYNPDVFEWFCARCDSPLR